MVLESVALVGLLVMGGLGIIQQTYLCFYPNEDSDIPVVIVINKDNANANANESRPLLPIK